MVAEINNSPAAVADGRTPDEIAAEFVHRFRLDTPDLTEGAISMDVEEVQVDVSGDRQRAIFDRSRPFYMPGFRVTYYVPFRGDTDLLKCQPNTFAIAAIRRLRRLYVYFLSPPVPPMPSRGRPCQKERSIE